MPVTNRMAEGHVPVILREIADGLDRSFGSETRLAARFMTEQVTVNEEQEEALLRQKEDDEQEEDESDDDHTPVNPSAQS